MGLLANQETQKKWRTFQTHSLLAVTCSPVCGDVYSTYVDHTRKETVMSPRAVLSGHDTSWKFSELHPPTAHVDHTNGSGNRIRAPIRPFPLGPSDASRNCCGPGSPQSQFLSYSLTGDDASWQDCVGWCIKEFRRVYSVLCARSASSHGDMSQEQKQNEATWREFTLPVLPSLVWPSPLSP